MTKVARPYPVRVVLERDGQRAILQGVVHRRGVTFRAFEGDIHYRRPVCCQATLEAVLSMFRDRGYRVVECGEG